MSEYPLKIVGIGQYLPEKVLTNEELAEKYGADEEWCEKKAGIKERRVAENETIAFMCNKAIEEACKDAGIEASEIDYMINAGNAFDYLMPEQSIYNIKECKGIRNDIKYININCGCLSFMAALDMAASLINNSDYKYIVICSGLIVTKMIGISKDDESFTVGDGAAAVVIKKAESNEKSGIITARMETYGDFSGAKGFVSLDNTTDTRFFSKEVLCKGVSYEFDTKQMQSEGIKHNKGFMEHLFPKIKDNVDKVIPNQSTRIASDMLKILFQSNKIKTIIDKYGNTGAVGPMLALYELIKNKEVERNDSILFYAMGAGFSIYGLLLIY